ncbi:hemagglutinin/hemolysin-related protein [Leifsonia xyli subsp. xyli str. CTCB07]|uniref:Hemagglutinin/hemolysin-related protein n=1 Tax=Leifsonia xyli subsp. xyli (strain CTCB07) TaxID=281090 RepID=Q6AG28_LEIXX|nr:hemagglutinin/hemolysin-related protein [Leifsonia xyli subsp. xyli str. CTCB07]
MARAADAPTATVAAIDGLQARYSNVVERVSATAQPFATTDVVGGAGYMIDTANGLAACSLGFSAWTPGGGPAVITAGHCAEEATGSPLRTLPSAEPAAGGPRFARMSALGNVGFAQFGDAGGSAGFTGDPDSIDIADIDVTEPSLTLLPAVTNWTTAASDDLSAAAISVKAVANPALGSHVSKSGRTTGFTTGGTVVEEGWAMIGGRWVRGFKADGLTAGPGDSGGAVIQNNTAVGLVSGGVEGDFTWVADIVDALALTSGYTLRLVLDAAAISVAPGASVTRGSRITGTTAAGATVTVSGDNDFTATATAAADGSWSFAAPMTEDPFSFTTQAQDSFNVSADHTTSVTLVAAPLTAPVVTSPAPGARDTPVTAITGTANPGYTVTVSGDAAGTAVATPDGTWTIHTTLNAGTHRITVTQSFDGDTSAETVVTFQIAETAAPVTPPEGTPGSAASPVRTATASVRLADAGSDTLPTANGAVALLLTGLTSGHPPTTRCGLIGFL